MPRKYPIFMGSEVTAPRGVTSGEDDSPLTTKKIWKDAEIRAIEDNRANREKAYSIDALTSLIVKVQTFSILGSYEVHSADDEKHSDLVKRIEDWIVEFKMIKSFRESFPDIEKHGYAYFQKLYKNGAKLNSEPKGLLSLQQLIGIEKHKNPFDSQDFFLFQELEIASDWKNPKGTQKKLQKVWILKDGEENKAEYPHIESTDIIVNLDDIIEIKNNESGESAISACLNEIYIKNLILLNLPNLVYLLVAPGLGLEYQTRDKDGNWIVPEYPDSRLEESNKEEYDRQKSDYDTFVANIQTLANNIINDWYKKGITVHSDMMKLSVIESQQAMNPSMLEVMIKLLNTEIAFALGFPIALLDAHGTELATSQAILTTMSAVLNGIQNQYEQIGTGLIYEQFPEAKEADIKFRLSELNPKDAKDLAEVEKVHAAILKIYKEIGASDGDLKALSRKYGLLEEPELGGEGLAKGMGEASAEAYPEADMIAAFEMIHRITEDRKAVAIGMEEIE